MTTTATPHAALAYIAAPTGTGVIGCDPERVEELSEADAKDILARVMRVATGALAEIPDPFVPSIRGSVEVVADSLDALAKHSDPLSILESWNVPEAERQGYLSGLAEAERVVRQVLDVEPGSEVLEDTAKIGAFMGVMEQTVRAVPTTDITANERVLRPRLVLEEALEFVEAMGCTVHVPAFSGESVEVTKGVVVVEIDPDKEIDLVEATDALADITVVTKGSGHTLGIPVDAAFRVVNDTNNAKAPGGVLIRRPDGKVLKPEGWQPPTAKLVELLVEHGADL